MRHVLGLASGVVVIAMVLCGTPVGAQTFDSGSTGVDGPFSPTANTTLALPPDGVFNFTTITVPAGVTVTFTRNVANTPVTMLASGDVTIAGTIDGSGSPGGGGVFGATTLANNRGAGGPGGFDGGSGANGIVSTTGGAGLGPGGGAGGPAGRGGGGAGFASSGASSPDPGAAAGGQAYGTPALLPLVGGSGGGGGGAVFGNTGGGGGGGGGALLIASSGTITFTGTIRAGGGTGGGGSTFGVLGAGAAGAGSGGAVRLVATTITGSGGSIDVAGGLQQATTVSTGGAGSAGRIRTEAFTNTATINFGTVPPETVSVDDPTVVTLADAPSLSITSVAGVAAPTSPTGSFSTPDIVLPADTTNPVTVALAAANVPVGTTLTVTVSGQVGGSSSVVSSPLTGTLAASTASASVTIPTDQPSVVSAAATFTVTAALGGGPVFVQGEEVERVRVVAIYGGPMQVAYITKSGREVLLPPRR